VTVRNNIFNLTGNASTGVELSRRGNEGPHVDNRAYNNTCYSRDIGDDETCVRIHEDVSQSLAANNLLVAPNARRASVVLDKNGANTLENNLTVENPAFAVEPPTQPAHFALTSGSTNIINKGADHGLAAGDFALNKRCLDGDGTGGRACDVGAYEYGADLGTARETDWKPAFPAFYPISHPANPAMFFVIKDASLQDMHLDIFTPDGDWIQRLSNKHHSPSSHLPTWDISNVAGGIYLVRLVAKGKPPAVQKVIVH
jgi:hypothetical protein